MCSNETTIAMSYNDKSRPRVSDNGSVRPQHNQRNHHHHRQQQQEGEEERRRRRHEEDEESRRQDEERAKIVARYKLGREPGAEIDPWEDPTFEVYHVTDRYGFMHDSRLPDTPTADELKNREHEFVREKKWLQMVAKWSQLRAGKDRKLLDKFRSRVYKGVPHKLRGRVWQLLLNVDQEMEKNRGRYQEMCDIAHKCSPEVRQIDLDVNRTYRDHIMFRQRYDIKQTELFNVLAAYSMYNSELGYCQGMSQIAALLLMFLNEEEAFWALSVLMTNKLYAMHGMFIHGFPKLMRFQRHHDKILKKYMPKLKKHLDKNGVDSGIYTLKWFFQCFLDRVPFTLALRFWDVFLLEGDCVLTAASFTILKLHKRNLLRLSMEEILDFLQVRLQKTFGLDDDAVVTEMEKNMDDLRRSANLSAGQPDEAELPRAEPPQGTIRSRVTPAGWVSATGSTSSSAVIAELQQQQQRSQSSKRSLVTETEEQNTSFHDTSVDEVTSATSSLVADHPAADTSFHGDFPDRSPPSAEVRSIPDRSGPSSDFSHREALSPVSLLASGPYSSHQQDAEEDDVSNIAGCNGLNSSSRASPPQKVSIYVPYPGAVSDRSTPTRLPAVDSAVGAVVRDDHVSDSALRQIDDALNQVLDAAVDLSLEPQITIQQQRHSGTTRVTIRQRLSPSPIPNHPSYTSLSLSPSLSPISPKRTHRSSRSSSPISPLQSPLWSGACDPFGRDLPPPPPVSPRSQPPTPFSEKHHVTSPPMSPRRPFSASFQDGITSVSDCHVWTPHAPTNLPPVPTNLPPAPVLPGSLPRSKYSERHTAGDSSLTKDLTKPPSRRQMARTHSPPVPPARTRSTHLAQSPSVSPPNHITTPTERSSGNHSRL